MTRIFLSRILGRGELVPEGLLSQRQFRTVIERERMRADRTQSTLSLLAFTPPTGVKRRDYVRRLAEILIARLRATDVAGLLSDRRLAALLPDTSASAAWRVAEDVRDAFDDDKGLRCELLCHPFSSGIDAGQPQTGESDSSSGGPRREPDGVVEELPEESVGRSSEAERHERSAAPLHQVLIKPLPWWKRTLDILGASVGLVLLSPLLLLAAVAIKLTSRGPVFFTQPRAGLGGKPFKIYKFRTMCIDAEQQKDALRAQNEQDGPAFKIKRDPRVTTIGRYLRKTCVDELPQLWNVLRGDMTLVGPRPLPVNEQDECQDWEQRRLDVTPGLTCIWQAAGRRERISFSDWMRMDLRYIKRRGIRRDLALLWRTFVNVIFHRGSH